MMFYKIMKMSLIQLEEWSFVPLLVSGVSYWPKLIEARVSYLYCHFHTKCNL